MLSSLDDMVYLVKVSCLQVVHYNIRLKDSLPESSGLVLLNDLFDSSWDLSVFMAGLGTDEFMG